MPRLFPSLLALLLVLSACDTQDNLITPQDTTPDPNPLPAVTRSAVGELEDRSFRLSLTTLGAIKSPRPINFFEPVNPSDLFALSAGGLWIGADQNGGSHLNLIRYPSDPSMDTDSHSKSSYGPCSEDSTRGVFHVFADTTYSEEGWPAEHGAPMNADGSPKAFGTEMLWASMCSKATPPSGGYSNFSSPLDGLRVNTAVFVHERQDVVFIRYDIRNESTSPMTDATVGFWADPDWAETPINLSGFDLTTSMNYVYLDSTKIVGGGSSDRIPRTDRERGQVLGLVPLETPFATGITANRFMQSNVRVDTPWSGHGLTFEDNRNALRGLLNDGTPQSSAYQTTRPLVTSPFAFTGDPLTGEGWLDGYFREDDTLHVGTDVRQLIASGPFDLQPGASTTFTLAYITESRDSLADGLQSLKEKAARIQSQPSLWRFPVES